MIGNIDNIVDILAKKSDLDKETISIILSEFWKSWKYKIRNSEASALPIPKLGRFVIQNTRLRYYIRVNIQRRRKELSEDITKYSEETQNLILQKREDRLRALKIALKQLDIIRPAMMRRRERLIKELKERDERENKNNKTSN